MPLASIAAENPADSIRARISKKLMIAMMNAIAAKDARPSARMIYDNQESMPKRLHKSADQ